MDFLTNVLSMFAVFLWAGLREFAAGCHTQYRGLSTSFREYKVQAYIPRRSNCFDFLRLFAALTVVVQHTTWDLKLNFLWLHPGGRFWFYDGVPMFFVISGLLVFRSAEKCMRENRPLRQYSLNRTLRVVPAIYVYLAVSMAIFGALHLLSWPERAKFSLSTLAMVPVYNPDSLRPMIWNGSLWTIPVEVSFYAVVPALVWGARRLSRKSFLLLLAALFLFSALAGSYVDALYHGSMGAKLYQITFLWGLPFFAAGVFWANWWRDSRIAALVSFACYCAIAVWIRPQYHGVMLYFLSGIPLSYVTVWAGRNGPAFLSAITQKIGDLSYGTYVWHMVVINLVIISGLRKSNALIFVTTIVTASLSWWLVEKPCLRLKAFSSRETSADSQQIALSAHVPT